VTVQGLYWNGCIAEVREALPTYLREDCDGTWSNANGFLGLQKVEIKGYAAPASFWDDTNIFDVTNDELQPGISNLAGGLVDVIREKDADALSMLFSEEARGWARVRLKQPQSMAFWRYFDENINKFGANAKVPGSGFRHFATSPNEPTWGVLCFCRKAECGPDWKPTHWRNDEINPMKSSMVCYGTRNWDGKWFLDWRRR
jgi:hypothetical protein